MDQETSYAYVLLKQFRNQAIGACQVPACMNGQWVTTGCANRSTCLLNQQETGSHVPQVDSLFKGDINAAAGGIAEQQ